MFYDITKIEKYKNKICKFSVKKKYDKKGKEIKYLVFEEVLEDGRSNNSK